MRICIYGAGAVGAHLAARMHIAGLDVSVVARGEHLATIRAHGITLEAGEQRLTAKVRATTNPAELGPQDVVISTLKATAIHVLASDVKPLLGADTPIIFALNGIPWWYGYGLQTSRLAPAALSRLDPGGELARAIGLSRVMGAVVYSASEVIGPGIVTNRSAPSNGMTIAEIDDRSTARAADLRTALIASGFRSKPADDIRKEIWKKLIINLTASTLALLLEQPESQLNEPPIPEIFARLWREARALAEAVCGPLELSTDPPPPPAMRHKPSLLQDYERRRPMEIDGLIAIPLAFARAAGIATPTLDVVAALAIRRAADRGLYVPAPA
jgi:2-dehydropantoate 2-reductase